MPKKGDAFTKPDPAAEFDLDDFLSDATPHEESATVNKYGAMVAELQELEEQLTAAKQSALIDDRMNGGNDPERIAAQITALQEKMRGGDMTFRFQALPTAITKSFYSEAPKVKDDDGDEAPDGEWVAEAWVAKACVSINGQPAHLTHAKVQALRPKIGDGQFAALWQAAFTATNEKRVSVPFSQSAFMTKGEPQDS